MNEFEKLYLKRLCDILRLEPNVEDTVAWFNTSLGLSERYLQLMQAVKLRLDLDYDHGNAVDLTPLSYAPHKSTTE